MNATEGVITFLSPQVKKPGTAFISFGQCAPY